MSRPASLPPNPGHPFHRASYWLDHRKMVESGGGPVASVAREHVIRELEELLDANDRGDVDAEPFLKAVEYYGQSFTESTRIPLFLTFAIFLDGVMHALAFTGRREADPPTYPDTGEKPRVH